MPRSTRENRAIFDRWAETYGHEDARSGPLAGYEESILEAAAMLAIEKDASILDVGIGTGAFAGLFAARGARICGIDISEKMMEQCHAAHPHFALSAGSFTSIPYPALHFDAVVSSFSFHHVPQEAWDEALAEIARVLKPGGRFCLLDIMFLSTAAVLNARAALDDEEDYPLVGDLDGHLRTTGFSCIRWRQTAPFHWAVVGTRAQGPEVVHETR